MTEQCQLCIAMFRGLYGLNLAQEVDLVYLGMGQELIHNYLRLQSST